MLLISTITLVCLSAFALYFHFSYLFEKQKIHENKITVYSEGGAAIVEAVFLFKVNKLKNDPKGLWLMIESFWPITMTLVTGIFFVSLYAQLFESKSLSIAEVINQRPEVGSIEQSSKALENKDCPKIEDSKDSNGSAVRKPSSVDLVVTQPATGKYSFWITTWMAFFFAGFTNYLVKSRFYADKWVVCNKAFIELTGKKHTNYIHPDWKRFGHDLIITGMWRHRSFSTVFYKIVSENLRAQRRNFSPPIEEYDALRLLSDI